MKSAVLPAIAAFLATATSALKLPAQATMGRRAFVATAAFTSTAANAIAPEWDRDFLGVGAERNALSDFEQVPMQQASSGKLDLNNALVTDYKRLQGMYPHAAGLIASNGPYNSVSDLYKLPGATDQDKALFTRYKSEFVALAPGRTFYERINARQST